MPPLRRGSRTTSTDVVLAMNQPYMDQIVSGDRTYEFRKYKLSPQIKRVWFYTTSPECRISYICGINPAKALTSKDDSLPLNGVGNKEFNERRKGYGFAYEVTSVYKLREPLTLTMLKEKYGWKAAPRGMVYVTPDMMKDITLEDQIKIRGEEVNEISS
jgi:predicted transcriptional regulator